LKLKWSLLPDQTSVTSVKRGKLIEFVKLKRFKAEKLRMAVVLVDNEATNDSKDSKLLTPEQFI
jgi:hypothetical protein